MEGQNNLPGNVRRPHLKDKNFPGKLTQQREFSAERPLYAKKKKNPHKAKTNKKNWVLCCPGIFSHLLSISSFFIH